MKQNIDVDDVPEDIRILAHLDIMLGLNQNVREREDGLMRVSVLAHRHYKTSIKQALLLQQLEIGQFALDDRLIDRPSKASFDDGDGVDPVTTQRRARAPVPPKFPRVGPRMLKGG